MSHRKEVLRIVRIGGVITAILLSAPVVHADPLDPLSVTGNVQAKAVTEGSGDKLVWTIQNTTNVILTLDNGLRTRGLGFNYTGGDMDDKPAISSTTGCDSGVMLAAQTGACVLVIDYTKTFLVIDHQVRRVVVAMTKHARHRSELGGDVVQLSFQLGDFSVT